MIGLPPILANAVLLVSAVGFGNLVRVLYGRGSAAFRIDSVAITLLTGLGILGTLLFCIGQFWFSLAPILLILSVGLILSVRPIWWVFTNLKPLITDLQPSATLPFAIIAIVFAISAVAGLALPTGDMNNDSVAYHYLGPTVWLRQGIIRAVPDETLTFFPVVVEADYAALISLGGERGPGVFSVVSLLALLLSAAALASRMGLDRRGIWWSLAFLATMPAVYRGIYGGFIDAIFAAFVVMAARVGFDAKHPRHYAVCGIFCGLAMGTKYTGIMAVGLLVFSILIFALWANHSRVIEVLKYLTITSLVTIMVSSPIYLRNWLLYGCPIYPPPPALLHLFSPPGLLPGVMRELVKNVTDTGQGMGKSFAKFILLPFNLTYHTADFRGAGGIGLVPFALGPLGVLAMRRDEFAKKMAAFAIIETAAWFATAQVSRYLIPVYVIAGIFGGIGWRYVEVSASRYGRVLASLVVTISVVYGLMMILPERAEDLHAALSSKFEVQRRRKEIPYVESFEFINTESSVKRILILYPHIATYFIAKDYVKPFGRWGEQTLPGATDVNQVMAQLGSLRPTHVLDVKPEGGSFSLPDHVPGLTVVFANQDQRIYRVN